MSAEHCVGVAECFIWLLLRVNFSPFFFVLFFLDTKISNCDSTSQLISSLFFLYYSRWREAVDEGSKVDQQWDAECISVTVHSQGPAGESCSQEVMICVEYTCIINTYVYLCTFLNIYNKSISFKFGGLTFDSLNLICTDCDVTSFGQGWYWVSYTSSYWITCSKFQIHFLCQHELYHSQIGKE